MRRRHALCWGPPSFPEAALALRGGGPLALSMRSFSGLFEEAPCERPDKAVGFAIHADYLRKRQTVLNRKAYGIPFHISDAEAVDSVCRHHGASVEIHRAERYMLPFWLVHTSAMGAFRGEILQRDPAFLTQQHCLVWVGGPNYEFSYPFGEFMPFNQVSASYLEPLRMVESCLMGSHVPSMLISRFELVKELEAMRHRPRLIPFAMSTATALSVVEKRMTRRLVMDRIDTELRKFHGSFVRSNITITQLWLEAVGIRPVFLPLLKLQVSTATASTPVPAFVCGATGKVVGPVLHVPPAKRLATTLSMAVGAVLGLSPFLPPGIVTAGAIAAGMSTSFLQQYLRTQWFLREQARQMDELKTVGVLNLASDATGYRWSPEDEEKEEYEYREELRRQARQKSAFEQRVKEEAARDRARAQGSQFDPKNRRRTDLENCDPLGYYGLLGLAGKEFTATAKEISRAFREAVHAHHPDVHQAADADAKKKYMQRLIEAYKVLHDPKTKKAYDRGEKKVRESDDA